MEGTNRRIGGFKKIVGCLFSAVFVVQNRNMPTLEGRERFLKKSQCSMCKSLAVVVITP